MADWGTLYARKHWQKDFRTHLQYRSSYPLLWHRYDNLYHRNRPFFSRDVGPEPSAYYLFLGRSSFSRLLLFLFRIVGFLQNPGLWYLTVQSLLPLWHRA